MDRDKKMQHLMFLKIINREEIFYPKIIVNHFDNFFLNIGCKNNHK